MAQAQTKQSIQQTEPSTALEQLRAERASLARELADLNRAASRLQEAATSEASALAELAALSDQDTAAMKRWASTGCVGNPPEPDAKQRRALGERLSSAQAAATAAKAAGADIDHQISELNNRLRAISDQIEQAIFDAMEIEHGQILAQYRDVCAHVALLAAKLHGLASYYGDAGRNLISKGDPDAGATYLQRASALTNIKLPNPGVTRHEIETAALEWSRRAATLRNGT